MIHILILSSLIHWRGLTESKFAGKRHNKTHTLCRRCGNRSYHIQKSTCSSCGYPSARIRKCKDHSLNDIAAILPQEKENTAPSFGRRRAQRQRKAWMLRENKQELYCLFCHKSQLYSAWKLGLRVHPERTNLIGAIWNAMLAAKIGLWSQLLPVHF